MYAMLGLVMALSGSEGDADAANSQASDSAAAYAGEEPQPISDLILGGDEADALTADSGDDVLLGAGAGDQLSGSGGDDIILGQSGDGDDKLIVADLIVE